MQFEEKISNVKRIGERLSDIEADFLVRGESPALSIDSLPGFNRKIWGLRCPGLTVLGARTSQGKSSLALQMAYDLASSHKPSLFVSLEMDENSLIERLFCMHSFVDNYSLLSGQYKTSPDLQKQWSGFKDMVEKLPLLITCGIGHTWGELNELILSIEPKPQAVFIDYIQNISVKAGETREGINEYIRQFRNMAIKHKFAGILCSQINRGAEQNKNNEPFLSQLKESGFLEESADCVLLLHYPDFYDNSKPRPDVSEYKIIVAKNRNGRTGEYLVNYTPRFYRFSEKGVEHTESRYDGDPLENEEKIALMFGAKRT